MSLSRRTINPPLAPMNARFLDSSDEESEDEETRLEREEEEQERLLSKQFGEAQESNLGMKRKKEENIEAEYTSSKPKKKRLVLTPAMLTSSANGLLRLSSEFPRIIRWRNSSTHNKVQAAAVYSRTLVNAYKSFCYDLFPNMAFSDVLTRIETFGSKKEVKEYLQHLRQQVCSTHLERIYGKEQAQRMMEELQHGLEQQQHGMDEFGHFDQGEEGDYEVQRGPAIQSSDGNTNEETRPVSTTKSSHGAASITKENATKSRLITNTDATTTKEAAVAHAQDDDLQDSDDELEFVVNAKPAPVNPFADDDSDDDDAEEDKDIMAHDTNSTHKRKVEDGRDDHTAVSKTVTNATQDNNDIDDVEMADDDDATVVVAGFQTNANQVTRPEESSATTTLHDTQQTNDDDDVMEEEEPTANDDDDDKVNVSPQKTQQDSPLSSSSNETATIVPSMTESQLDTDAATQVNDTEHVATEQAALAVDASASTQEETPTQLESPGVENKESTVAES